MNKNNIYFVVFAYQGIGKAAVFTKKQNAILG
jgi:hypothetical protein